MSSSSSLRTRYNIVADDVTTEERSLLEPRNGVIVYDTDKEAFYEFAGGVWVLHTITSVSVAKNELGYDAWGRLKVVNDDSLLHGLFTYNVPVRVWYEEINDVLSPTITNCTSVDGALNVLAGGTLSDTTYLRTFRNPRYEPNRGAIYSTSSWITNPNALMTREWGTFTAESGVFFRLKSGGTLVGVIRTTVQGSTT